MTLQEFNAVFDRLLAVFDEIVNKRKAELSFTPNEYGESLDLTQMK